MFKVADESALTFLWRFNLKAFSGFLMRLFIEITAENLVMMLVKVVLRKSSVSFQS